MPRRRTLSTATAAVVLAAAVVVSVAAGGGTAAAAVSSQPPPGGQYYPTDSSAAAGPNAFIVDCGGGTIDLASLVPGITGVASVTENLTTTITPTPGGTPGQLDVAWSGTCLFDEATVMVTTGGAPFPVTIYIGRVPWHVAPVDTVDGYPANLAGYPSACRPNSVAAGQAAQVLWSTSTGEAPTPTFTPMSSANSLNTLFARTYSNAPDTISYPATSWAAMLFPTRNCMVFFEVKTTVPSSVTTFGASDIEATDNTVLAGGSTTVDHLLDGLYDRVPSPAVGTDWCGAPPYAAGDANSDTFLDDVEAWRYGPCNTGPLYQDSVFQFYRLPPVAGVAGGAGLTSGAPGVYSAWGDGGDRYQLALIATAPALVDVSNELTLTKSADTEVCCGDGTPVNYTFEVGAVGADWTSEVTVTDDQCAAEPVEAGGFNVGDLNQDGYLQGLVPGVQEPETWQFACQQTISETTTNTATATAVTEDAWPNPAWSTGGPVFMPPGELPPIFAALYPAYLWTDMPEEGFLDAETVNAAPQSWTVELAPASSIEIRKRIESSPGSGDFIEADDSDNEIALVYADTPASFEISVTNTGDQALTDVTVVDDTVADCDRVIGDLAVGETVTYTCAGVLAGDGETAATVTSTVTVGDCDDPPTAVDVARHELEDVPPIEPPPPPPPPPGPGPTPDPEPTQPFVVPVVG